MSQVNTQPQLSQKPSGVTIAIIVVAVLAVLYYYNSEAVNKWVSNVVAPYMSHSDTSLGGVTNGTNPAATPVTPNTPVVVGVSATNDAMVPYVRSIVITKDTTKSLKPEGSNDDWQTFQIGEVKVYKPDGYVLKAADFESVAYTAGSNETILPWNQSVLHPAMYAVDGDPSTYSSTTTNGGNIHQLTLVLKNTQTITKVEILNRSDCCQERLKGAVVELKDVQGVVLKSKVLDEALSQIIVL